MNPSASQDPDLQRADARQEYDRRREFAGLFEEAPMFMALLHGPQHHVEFVNPGYRRLIGHRDIIGRLRLEVMGDQLAASTLVGVQALALPDFRIEIEAIAVLD